MTRRGDPRMKHERWQGVLDTSSEESETDSGPDYTNLPSLKSGDERVRIHTHYGTVSVILTRQRKIVYCMVFGDGTKGLIGVGTSKFVCRRMGISRSQELMMR